MFKARPGQDFLRLAPQVPLLRRLVWGLDLRFQIGIKSLPKQSLPRLIGTIRDY